MSASYMCPYVVEMLQATVKLNSCACDSDDNLTYDTLITQCSCSLYCVYQSWVNKMYNIRKQPQQYQKVNSHFLVSVPFSTANYIGT